MTLAATSSRRLRDKDYVRTPEGLLLNIIGYDHPATAWLANLKYVGGRKWTDGYHAAREFLERRHPVYVERFIQVPHDRIERVYQPQTRLNELRERAPCDSGRVSRLSETTIQLADALSATLGVDPQRLGVTDSLLWGEGGADSDIDLVGYGQDAVDSYLALRDKLFQIAGFQRLPASAFSRSAEVTASAVDWERARRVNKGRYSGERFSLRFVRDPAPPSETWRPTEPVEMSTEIRSERESLYFPVEYPTTDGISIVSFCTRHEGVFRAGDHVHVAGVRETDGARERIVIQRWEGLRLLST